MPHIEQLVESMADWSATPTTEAIKSRRQILSDMSVIDRALLSNMIDMVRTGREHVLQAYASSLEFVLEMEGLAGTTLDPEELLVCAEEGGDDPGDDRRRFEAISVFDLALMLWWIETEPAQSRYVVHGDVYAIVRDIQRHLFSKGTRRVRVYSLHNPKDMRVREVQIEAPSKDWSPEDVLRHEVMFRVTGRNHLAVFDDRPKGLFETALKMLKGRQEGKKNWLDVRDRRGIRLVTLNEDDIETVIEELQEVIPAFGATFDRDLRKLRMDDGVMNPTNPQSSKEFNAKKGWITYNCRINEIQFMDVKLYIATRYAISDVNRSFYRLRQMCDVYGELLWPKYIYGVDWQMETNPGGTLYEEAVAKLAWRSSRRR